MPAGIRMAENNALLLDAYRFESLSFLYSMAAQTSFQEGSMSKSKVKGRKRVKTIPIDQIRFLNPRVRNRRNFQEIVQSIANVGLKRPIHGQPAKERSGPGKL